VALWARSWLVTGRRVHSRRRAPGRRRVQAVLAEEPGGDLPLLPAGLVALAGRLGLCALTQAHYSPECLEGGFSEVRRCGGALQEDT
jgi:hypothetical protein